MQQGKSLRRTGTYASLLGISGAPEKRDFASSTCFLDVFEQPANKVFFRNLLMTGAVVTPTDENPLPKTGGNESGSYHDIGPL